MARISRIEIGGFKSIKELPTFDLNPVNILIGANGSGKSNLVSFFRLLSAILAAKLRDFVGRAGGADGLLHYGAKQTPELWGSVEFGQRDVGYYRFRLAAAADDSFVFSEEAVTYPASGPFRQLGAGHKESLLNQTTIPVWDTLPGPHFFHFNDTSENAPILKHGYVDDNRRLRADAGNLAAFLLNLKLRQTEYYERIRNTIREVAPFFADFELEPPRENENTTRLNWRDVETGHLFGPHQLSDGTLRAMALITLLLQPLGELPLFIVLDEPEIGLHPYAMEIVASLIRSASVNSQLLIATQSAAMVNHFAAEDVIVTERTEGQSRFSRLDPRDLDMWLKDYSIGELWEKNLIGGTPSR